MGFYRMWSEISEALVSKFDCSYFVAYQAGRYMAEDAIDRGAVFNNLDSEHLKERIADLMSAEQALIEEMATEYAATHPTVSGTDALVLVKANIGSLEDYYSADEFYRGIPEDLMVSEDDDEDS